MRVPRDIVHIIGARSEARCVKSLRQDCSIGHIPLHPSHHRRPLAPLRPRSLPSAHLN